MDTNGPNTAQIEHWNSRVGEMWAAFQTEMDATIGPLGELAMAAANVQPGEHVLDIGCGCGDTTLSLADRVGTKGTVLGLDVSEPMLNHAKRRAAGRSNISFRRADVETHAFEPGRHDLVFSRFGVMFFQNPTRAFSNLRRALKPGGRLAFLCWQAREANPFFAVPRRAARNHVDVPPPAGPREPGLFAFAEEGYVRRLLGEAGFDSIDHAPHEALVRIAGTPDFSAVLAFLMRIGPMAQALAEVGDDTRRRVKDDLAAILRPHYRGDGVYLRTRTWVVTARRPD